MSALFPPDSLAPKATKSCGLSAKTPANLPGPPKPAEPQPIKPIITEFFR